MLPLFLEFPDKNFTVIEPSEDFFENAKKLSCNRNNVELINVFFDEKTTLPQKFDMIICSCLLHEVDNPNCILDAIFSTASTNSFVHINVPNAYSIHKILAKESGIIDSCFEKSERNIELQQSSVFDLNSLSRIAKQHGFEIIEKGSYFIKPFSHKQMKQLLDNKIIGEDVIEGLYKLSTYLPEFGSEIFINCRKKKETCT